MGFILKWHTRFRIYDLSDQLTTIQNQKIDKSELLAGA